MRRTRRSTLVPLLVLACLLLAARTRAADELAPRLARPAASEASPSYRAAGLDPGAPRLLVLWRWDGFRFYRIASTRSEPGGRFDFGEQALPSSRVDFHVSAGDEEPDPQRLLRIERPLPAPGVVSGGLGSSEITLVPAGLGGELRIYDAASGRLLLRKPVELRERVVLDLAHELMRPWPAALSIEQVLDDGLRSEREVWPLD